MDAPLRHGKLNCNPTSVVTFPASLPSLFTSVPFYSIPLRGFLFLLISIPASNYVIRLLLPILAPSQLINLKKRSLFCWKILNPQLFSILRSQILCLFSTLFAISFSHILPLRWFSPSRRSGNLEGLRSTFTIRSEPLSQGSASEVVVNMWLLQCPPHDFLLNFNMSWENVCFLMSFALWTIFRKILVKITGFQGLKGFRCFVCGERWHNSWPFLGHFAFRFAENTWLFQLELG